MINRQSGVTHHEKQQVLFGLACCPRQGGIKCWHTWFEFPFCRGACWHVPSSLRAASARSSYLNYENVYNSSGEVNSQPATSLSTDGGGNQHRGPKNPLGQLTQTSVCQDVPMLAWGCSGSGCVWKWRAVSEYRAVLLCAVNGTLVLCLIICHGRLMILSDSTVPFNFVFIKSALYF